MNLLTRIGIFFFIVGIFSLIIFGAYLRSESEGGIQYFLVGVISTSLGGVIWNRFREKPPPSRLFRLFRRRGSKEDQEDN